MADSPQLERSLSLPIITLYGLGTVVGAGIYVLIGKVAAQSGIYTPISFLLAGLVALFTALSYTELVSRFPKCAGASIYVQKAWNIQLFSLIIGLLVIFTGIVSAATITHGFVGYIKIFFSVNDNVAIILFIIILSLVAIWGIKESAILIFIITLIELGGLFFVLIIGSDNITIPLEEIFSINFTTLPTIMLGSFLAFYAFIGFEDMVNIVEEVKHPRRNLPLAIIFVITISTIMYVAVSYVSINILPPNQLANSNAPITDIVIQQGYSPKIIGIISLIAVVNGALVQIIMSSRMLYGMAKQNMLPTVFSTVNTTTHTPIFSTIIVAIIIVISALSLPIITLAKITSLIMLIIYSIVNFSLLKVKVSQTGSNVPFLQYHYAIPIIGAILCIILIMSELYFA